MPWKGDKEAGMIRISRTDLSMKLIRKHLESESQPLMTDLQKGLTFSGLIEEIGIHTY